MKRFILLIAVLFFGVNAFAQDIITKKDATEIQAKVVKVGTYEIEYKHWNNLDGPVYTIPVGEVFTIKYENGQRDVFSQFTSKRAPRNKTNNYSPHYEGDVALGYALSLDYPGSFDQISVETVHGIRIMPYLFTGIGTGVHIFYKLDGAMALPLFINVKGYYPTSDRFSAYLSADLGGIVGIYNLWGGSFYTSVGPGIQIGRNKAFDFSLRYQYFGNNSIMARFGLRF